MFLELVSTLARSWVFRPEWVIVWVTTAYTLVSAIALYLLGYQIRQSKNATERQLRAYVVPETCAISNVANVEPIEGLEPGASVVNLEIGPLAVVRIRNVGQTPTYDARHSQTIYIRAFPTHASQLPKLEFTSKPSVLILGPNVGAESKIWLPHPLTDLEVANLQQGLAAIYVIGLIEYSDIFGAAHSTNYKLIHHANGGRIGFSSHLLCYEDGNSGD